MVKESILTIDGHSLPVEMRRRKGSRHLRMHLSYRNTLTVSLPWHCSERSAWDFVEQQRPWIREQLVATPPPVTLSEWLRQNPALSASGRSHEVRMERPEGTSRSRYYFPKGDDALVLVWPEESEETALLRLVRSFAKDALQCRIVYQTRRLGIDLPQLSVRDQSSRWGSCSSKKRLSLNWRLVLLAPNLQDYIILHELAHLKEMNHSHRFWALLDRYDPDRIRHEKELDACSPAIMRVGR
jgi:predicted metal-dependent hydrolase